MFVFRTPPYIFSYILGDEDGKRREKRIRDSLAGYASDNVFDVCFATWAIGRAELTPHKEGIKILTKFILKNKK